tara:strand:+ start:2384 stop:3544 length:1161 start_codon:yes stop_codon:yes gene_type:complete
MVKEKKNFNPYKGNSLNQVLRNSSFVKEFNTWREHCQGVSGGAMKVKNVPNLYMFLKQHFIAPLVRSGSRNAGFAGEGANELLTVIENAVDNDLFTVGNAKIIKQLATVLKEWENTGDDAGGTGIAADPAFILFTESVKGARGKLRDKKVQGHYRTDAYVDRFGGDKIPAEWLAGENPPHQALYSETKTEFANPRGLLHIMQDATKDFDQRNTEGFADIELEVDTVPEGFEAEDFEQIGAIEEYFNKAVKNTAFWSAGGKLQVAKLRRDFQAQTFTLKPKDQDTIRELARLGKVTDNDAIAGKVTEFKLTATATPLITLIDRALKRKGTVFSPTTHPEGGFYRAWQNATKRGFDYRKTRREEYGEDTQSPNSRVIGKMWQTLLWRD